LLGATVLIDANGTRSELGHIGSPEIYETPAKDYCALKPLAWMMRFQV
jgi:hypothetical protein